MRRIKDNSSMIIVISLGLLISSSLAFGQAKILQNDPCFSDYKSNGCIRSIQSKIFFMSTIEGEVRNEETSYVNDYFKKYGIEGFYGPPTIHHPNESLFEYAINTGKNLKLNKKLIEALPLGTKLFGKNVFDMVILQRPFTRGPSMQNYIDNVSILFPKEGNEKFQITKTKFGLDWSDPTFPQKYLDQINAVIKIIDDHNSFFKKSELLSEKKQLIEVRDRVEALVLFPKKACDLNSIEEYRVLKQDFGDLYRSSSVDIIECLVKGEKYILAKDIIKEGDYDTSKLPGYFDQAMNLKESNETYDYAKFLFGEMAKKGQKINLKGRESQRDFLQRGSKYLHKYQKYEEVICHFDFSEGSKMIVELANDLNMILFLEAYQLMEKILSEQDPMQKEKMVDQFVDLTKVGNSLGLRHPTNQNSILHLIADAGDDKLYKILQEKDVLMILLGYNVKDSQGNTPVIAAIKKGESKNIKFAIQYMKGNVSYDKGEIDEIFKATKKLKADEEDVKILKKHLKWEVKEEKWEN